MIGRSLRLASRATRTQTRWRVHVRRCGRSPSGTRSRWRWRWVAIAPCGTTTPTLVSTCSRLVARLPHLWVLPASPQTLASCCPQELINVLLHNWPPRSINCSFTTQLPVVLHHRIWFPSAPWNSIGNPSHYELQGDDILIHHLIQWLRSIHFTSTPWDSIYHTSAP